MRKFKELGMVSFGIVELSIMSFSVLRFSEYTAYIYKKSYNCELIDDGVLDRLFFEQIKE